MRFFLLLGTITCLIWVYTPEAVSAERQVCMTLQQCDGRGGVQGGTSLEDYCSVLAAYNCQRAYAKQLEQKLSGCMEFNATLLKAGIDTTEDKVKCEAVCKNLVKGKKKRRGSAVRSRVKQNKSKK